MTIPAKVTVRAALIGLFLRWLLIAAFAGLAKAAMPPDGQRWHT
jgi:hypothetical protein